LSASNPVYTLWQRALSELIGTALIVAAVLGAGYMVQQLGAAELPGLFVIAVVVAAVLFVVITALGPISGAHFNPLVTIALFLRGENRAGWLSARESLGYLTAQLAGALLGALSANLMFARPMLAQSGVERLGLGLLFGELIATGGLILAILLLVDAGRTQLVAPVVAAWIFAGHVFTSSTSFANPAVTIGRMFSDAVSSISPASALGFIAAQLIAAGLALATWYLLKPEVNRVNS